MKSYDNFFLPVADMEEAKKFYGEKLGLSIKFEFPQKGMTAFSVGDEEPAIILKDIAHYPEAKGTIWFMVEDVAEKYEQLRNEGVVFLSEPYPVGTGKAVEFEDQFGNRLGITDYSK